MGPYLHLCLSQAGSGGAWGPVTGGVMQRAVSCAQPVEDFEKKALAAVVSHAKAGTGLGLPICKQVCAFFAVCARLCSNVIFV